jgi:hypothetical protein
MLLITGIKPCEVTHYNALGNTRAIEFSADHQELNVFRCGGPVQDSEMSRGVMALIQP